MLTKTTSIKTHQITQALIIISFIISSSFFNYSMQAQSFCFTPTESKKSNFRQSFNTKILQDTYYLKIYVHVIRNTNGSGGYTTEEVDEILGYLDSSFNPHDIFFDWDENIDFIDDDYWAFGPGYFYFDDDIFEVNNHTDGIDIYLFPESAYSAGGLANGVGESSEFWVSGSSGSYGSYAKSYVVAHEMGHVLNLWHTHHGCETDGIWEATDGSNCETSGDFICDTPADPDMDFSVDPVTCEWNYNAYCFPPESVYSYNPDPKNIMSYSIIPCFEYFTAGQGERMRESIATLPYLQATLTSVSNDEGCNIDDWNALKKLYENTKGEIWTNNTNWDILDQDTIPENCTLRGMHGVTFNSSGRVVGINLYNNNLIGTIPAEIGDLTELRYLDLGFNYLRDTIPSQIGNLSNLEILFLDSNELGGAMPVELINLTNLGQLHLKNNMLNGCYDVELQALCNSLSGDNISISEGNNFEASFDDFCSFAAGICPIQQCNIDDWRALKALYISTNGTSWSDDLNWEMTEENLPPIDCDLRKLRGVSLNIEGRVMAIDLFDNNVTGYLPNEVGDLSELTYVDLGFNELSDTLPSTLKNLQKLTTLYLDNNILDGEIPKVLNELDALRILYLNNNSFTGCFDSSFVQLCTQLDPTYNKNKYISDGNQLIATWEEFCDGGNEVCALACAADWNALKQLYLNTGGDNWAVNTNWEIVLENSPPADCDFSSLYGIVTNENGNVVGIGLSNNNLTGTIPSEIGDFEYLTDLSLWNNNLTGVIPPEIGLLSNLTILDLYANVLTGNMPAELSDLSNLLYLYIDFNDLSGCFAPELATLCTQLVFYYIDGGNNFDASWSSFCESGSGACEVAALCNSVPELNLNGIHFEQEAFHSSKKISSNATIEANVIYKAGEAIELNTGFTADGNYSLDIKTERCE